MAENFSRGCKPNTLRQSFQTFKGAILRYLRAPSSNIRVQKSYLPSTVPQEAAWCGPTNHELPEISKTKLFGDGLRK